MRVLEVEGCRSSVVRAPVAKAGGPGFKSQATTKVFFKKGQNLIILFLCVIFVVEQMSYS